MLVLTRKLNQGLLIGTDVEVIVTEIRGGQVKLGIRAPAWVKVLRAELVGRSPARTPPTHP